MPNHKSRNRLIWFGLVLTILLGMSFLDAHPVMGHGGKSHGGNNFSSLQAVQKATELHDHPITMEKLPEEWETRIISIEVGTRQNNGLNHIFFGYEFKSKDLVDSFAVLRNFG